MKKLQQIKILQRTNWDFLIILDACRFDFFKETYRNYLNIGDLFCGISPATWTVEWVDKALADYSDEIVYVSGNPIIRSADNIQKEVYEVFPRLKEYSINVKFYKIIDAWNYGWSEKLGTVLPHAVTDLAIRTIIAYPNKKIVVHYLQPHFPYISLGGVRYWEES